MSYSRKILRLRRPRSRSPRPPESSARPLSPVSSLPFSTRPTLPRSWPGKRRMQSLPRPDNRLYFGVGGSGKTTLALSHSWSFDRVLIVDPNQEDVHTERAIVTSDPVDLVQLAALPSWRIAWRPENMSTEDGYDFATEVALTAKNVCLVWDEADF